VHHRRLAHEIGHAQPRVQRGEGVLEDHLRLKPHGLARRGVQLLQAAAVPQDLALAGRMQAGDETGQRGLAAPRLADQAHDLAVVHLQVHTVHRMHRLVARRAAERPHETGRQVGLLLEALADLAQLQQRRLQDIAPCCGWWHHSR
jgi:hypothetical protein